MGLLTLPIYIACVVFSVSHMCSHMTWLWEVDSAMPKRFSWLSILTEIITHCGQWPFGFWAEGSQSGNFQYFTVTYCYRFCFFFFICLFAFFKKIDISYQGNRNSFLFCKESLPFNHKCVLDFTNCFFSRGRFPLVVLEFACDPPASPSPMLCWG